MPEQQAVKEIGSYKKLGDVEIVSKRMFQDGDLKIFETVTGDYILPNGEPVDNMELMKKLPEPHKTKAVAWLEARQKPAKGK